MRTASLTRQAVVVAAVAAVGALGAAVPTAASAATGRARASILAPRQPRPSGLVTAPRAARLPVGEQHVCPAPTRPGQMECMSIISNLVGGAAIGPAVTVRGYGPADLRSAYQIASAARAGRGRTIAIVDAFSDPKAASDLASYRAHFRLGACTKANRCLRIVNERGRISPLPPANANWAGEESLDLDMVSAVCPKCDIVLVEASSSSTLDLGIAENTAVAMGARYVSNSWSGGEFLGQDLFDHYFNHPGDVIDFASGDFGYGPAYPTDLQYVTAIGGTTLRHARDRRGWTETVWGSSSPPGAEGTGSGCSTVEPKPSWQRVDATTPNGCLNRTENDVAAVANPSTGVAVFDTYRSGGSWLQFGGTSVATPIITAIYALAGQPARGSYPAEFPYLHGRHLFDVTSGANGSCESNRRYLCHGVRGYDGPTGLGTPNGTGAFTDGSAHLVTLIDPGTQDRQAGTAFSLQITGLDTARASSLSYRAAGLPAGLSIGAVPHSTNGRITGTLPGSAGTFHVVVTAKDGRAAGTTYFTIVTTPNLTAATPSAGPLALTSTSLCLDDNGGTAGSSVLVQPCNASSAQNWADKSDGKPDDIGVLTINGLCLAISGSHGVLATCNAGSAAQQWAYPAIGLLGPLLENPATGGCLASKSLSAGAQVGLSACNSSSAESWELPSAPLISGVAATCLDDPGNSGVQGTQVKIATCVTAEAEQQFLVRPDGLIQGPNGSLCLSTNGSQFDGTRVTIESCNNTDPSQFWLLAPNGEIINASSGRCLADPGNAGVGTGLVQEDCYGQAGEVWAIN